MHLLIPAAGSGKRMGSSQNKLLLPLHNRPMLAWTLQAASQAISIDWIGLLGQPTDFPDFERILSLYPIAKPVELIAGDETRQGSVFQGLKHLTAKGSVDYVLIHDGARCLATPELFDRCSAQLRTVDGLIAAIPVKDTIKITRPAAQDPHQLDIQSTPERKLLWAAQTPQGFELTRLFQAHTQAAEQGWEVTDDASLFERLNIPVRIVPGEETNLKLTTPLDLIIAERILTRRESGIVS